MFLSGGEGFQSTKVMPRSFSRGANTSTASTLLAPGRAAAVMSSRYDRKAPPISSGSLIRLPFSQTLAR